MMRMASKSVMGLESSNGFERNKATLLGRLFRAAAVSPGILKGILPSRAAVFAAFKKDPEKTVTSGQRSVVSPFGFCQIAPIQITQSI
jgi:hypothetical protein